MNVEALLRQAPKIVPPLDPEFRPAALGHRAFAAGADSSGNRGAGHHIVIPGRSKGEPE